MKRRLTPKEIIFNINLNEGKEKINLKDIPEIESALKCIRKAISIKESGYNLYLIDSFSIERIEEVKEYVEKIYEKEKAPRDICFAITDDEKKPEAFVVENGRGNDLKLAIQNLKNSYLKTALDFYKEDIKSDKDNIIDQINKEKSVLIDEIITISLEEGFEIKQGADGLAFVPIKEDKAMTEKEYGELTIGEKDEIIDKAIKLKIAAEKILDEIEAIEDDLIQKLKEIYSEHLNLEMEQEKKNLIINYLEDNNICEYLEKIYFLIEKELVECYSMNILDDEKYIEAILSKYDFLVLIDNANISKPPVIYEENPTLTKLIGNIEYGVENGGKSYVASLSSIVAGSLIKANDGCIIIRLNDLIANPSRYSTLKKVLINKKVTISSSESYLDLISVNGFAPKEIPLNVKVILVGDEEAYNILYNADEEFRMIFQMRAKINNTIQTKNINWQFIKEYIENRWEKHSTISITEQAIMEIIKYLVRISNTKNEISLDYNEIDRILILSAIEAKENKSKKVEKKDVLVALYTEEGIEDDIRRMYTDGKILIKIEGTCIGSVNGLAVIDTGFCKFGKPIRITSVASKGEGRIVDSQKESSLSGNTFEKSISILTGLLNNILCIYKKLPVDFYLSFEQTYGTIDGDSASVAFIICMLSSLSKIGVRQNMAVTGSINQFGEVQPIGGVNEKIEGFYKICKSLNKIEGTSVIIPASNKDEIILNEEVENSIKKGEFSIYTIETLNDAIEIMMLDSGLSLDGFYKRVQEEIEKWASGN